ncbi:type I restriction-modification system subunit M [Mycoplasma enhydrae]|uniref:type I restriction-modification system subunit M n=1 Tax=Mycoplasma enhydrae TaxID=2499220 RepID=UPI0021E87A51|nr:type I restriction-modification system subunit M [Mycoplasma enhydrae]MCV3733535.1 type I restriction-modification system subunit M [Mycoplasma enhydrae]
MNNKKESQRKELFSAIWKIAEDLRNNIDGWEFKNYVLGFLFYRYISERMIKRIEEMDASLSYVDWEDKDVIESTKKEIIETNGYFIKPSHLFQNVVKSKNDENLNEIISEAFKDIESSSKGQSSEEDFKDLFADIQINNPKLGSNPQERNKIFKKILQNIASINFGDIQNNEIDVFGDAYEFLIGMYAKNAGKSGGEYFTPQEVSELLARLTLIDFNSELKTDKIEINKIYDPACGSGSLLLKFAKILGPNKIKTGFYGQEKNSTTYNLARINMFLHNVSYEKFNIKRGDTLLEPLHQDLKPFDAIVSNPPYSVSWEGKKNPLLSSDERYAPAGVLAPDSKGDYAFIMHIIDHLSSSGTAAVVEFPGILYRTGAEQKIRKYLVEENFIDSIIQLPQDLFFGNSISTCIVVFRKNKANNQNILFVDASEEFIRIDSKNKLTNENISNIIDAVRHKKEIPHFSKLINKAEVVQNNYNLSVNQYVEQKDNKEIIDIKVLNEEIKVVSLKVNNLREQIDKIIKELDEK